MPAERSDVQYIRSLFSFGDLAYAETGAAFFSFEYLKINPFEAICLILALAGGIITALCIPEGKTSFARIAAFILVIACCAGGITFVHGKFEDSVSTEITWDNMSDAISDADAYHDLSDTGRALSASGVYQFLLGIYGQSFS